MNAGRQNVARAGGANANIPVDAPVQAEFPRPHHTGRRIIGVAGSAVDVERVGERRIFQQRNVGFNRRFLHRHGLPAQTGDDVVDPAGLRGAAVQRPCCTGEVRQGGAINQIGWLEIRIDPHRCFTHFAANRELHRAGPGAERRTREAGVDGLQVGVAGELRLQQHVIQRRLAFRRRPEDVDGDAAGICSRISQRHAADNLTIGRVDHGIECGGGLGAIHVCVVKGVLLFLAVLAGHRPGPVGTEHIDIAVKPAGKIERVEEGLRLARRGLLQHLAIKKTANTCSSQRLLNGRAQEAVARTNCIVTEFVDLVIILVVRLDVGSLRPDVDIVGQFVIGTAKHLRVD